MNALDLLIADHNRVRGLFARFRSAQEASDAPEMIELVRRIADELDIHTTIEEEIFYPVVRGASDDIADTVDEGLQEHHVANLLLTEISHAEPASDEWIAKVTVLIENVEHHVGEEEQDLFPQLRRPLSEQLDEMAPRIEDRKRALGAPVTADTIDLTKEELLDLARDQAIPGRSTMSHDELAATVAPR
jgi:hemerythrin-like domain-containing protein